MKIQSLHKSLLEAGANSNLINPPNEGQGRISTYLGKPLRLLARLIFGIACVTLIPIAGTLYHMAKTIDCALMSKNTTADKQNLRDKSWKHLKAAGCDALLVASTALLVVIAIKVFAFSNNIHDGDRAGLGFGLAFTTAFASFAIPLAYDQEPKILCDSLLI